MRPANGATGAPSGWRLARRAVGTVTVAAVSLTGALCGAAAVRVGRGRVPAREYLARRIARTVIRLGPTYIKAAQVLGTRRDVVPATLCDELAVLQDSVPALSPAAGRAALQDSYGDDLERVFASLDFDPVASGSIACVYRAVLPDGTPVAVKVRRPGIAPLMRADLDLLRQGAGLMARLPMFRGVPVREVVDSLCACVLGQLDFVAEAANLERMRAELATVGRTRVPRVWDELCRPTAIVMDYVSDLYLDTSERCSPAMRRSFAATTLAVVYQMLFINGFVHCDLHPGNLYFTARGQVVVLDAGFSAQLTPRMRRLFADFFLNMAIGRGRRCAEIVIESALGVRDESLLDSFHAGLAELVERNHRAPAKDFSLIRFAGELFDLQRRHGVAASPELVFPLLSLLVIEGTVRGLDPDIDFQEAARPTLNRALFGAV